MRRGRKIAAVLVVAALSAGVLGCGDSNTEPSIPGDTAQELANRIDEIRANVDEGSCVVAASRTDDLIAEINDLPSDVNQDVQNGLAEGANNLKDLLLNDPPAECETQTTTEETTTEETTTEETTTGETETQPTETQQTQTQPTQPTTPTNPGGGSGGVGPGGIGSP